MNVSTQPANRSSEILNPEYLTPTYPKPFLHIQTQAQSKILKYIQRAFDLAYYIYFASYFYVPADKWEEPDVNNYYLPDDQIKEFLSIYLAALSDGISSEKEIMEEFNIHTAYVILCKPYDDITCSSTSVIPFDVIQPLLTLVL